MECEEKFTIKCQSCETEWISPIKATLKTCPTCEAIDKYLTEMLGDLYVPIKDRKG